MEKESVLPKESAVPLKPEEGVFPSESSAAALGSSRRQEEAASRSLEAQRVRGDKANLRVCQNF